MSRSGLLRSVLYILTISLFAASSMAADTVPLPVKKVELYKNGMGYFEHLGSVDGSRDVEISLPGSRLNDILKSLTVLDLDGGRIDGVNYDSAAPLDRRLAELRVHLDSKAGLVEFLNSIRGAGIEFQTSNDTVSGKIVMAELLYRTGGQGISIQEAQVSLLTDKGEIRLVKPESIGAFRLTDVALAEDLGRYLDLLNTTHQPDVRNLHIRISGKGNRRIFIGYTSESPIWKATYRIVLDPKEKPLLQGWAIVDNTTPMDWKDVKLSLVAGAPISFIQDLSQPVYARRPVVPLPQGIRITPQVSQGTVDEEKSVEAGSFPAEAQSFAGVDTRAINIQQDGLNINDITYKTGINSSSRINPEVVSEFKLALSSVDAAYARASGRSVAEQFEYTIDRPVTILRNESALLPIIQTGIEGEKVSLYRSGNNEANPRLAFWLKNSSGLTFDGGPVTLIDENAFAGEGLFDTIQPGEKRLVGYAVDLGTLVSTTQGSEAERVARVVIDKGTISMHSKTVEKKTYKIRNNNDSPRTVVLEHPIRNDWKLIRPDPVESSTGFYRFKVEVKAKTTAELVVQEETPQESSYSVASVTPDLIDVWIKDRSIDPEIEKSLRTIADKKNEISDLDGKIGALDSEQRDIFNDQSRVRENLQRLDRTPEENTLRERYIDKLNSQEDRLNAIQEEHEKLDIARTAAQKQLDELIQNLSIDKKL